MYKSRKLTFIVLQLYIFINVFKCSISIFYKSKHQKSSQMSKTLLRVWGEVGHEVSQLFIAENMWQS